MADNTTNSTPPTGPHSSGDQSIALTGDVSGGTLHTGNVYIDKLVQMVGPSTQEMLNEWLALLGEGVHALLEARADTLSEEKLSQSREFVATVMHSSQIALHARQKEKLERLRNAVLNSISPDAPEVELQEMFLRFVEELGPTHLQLLQFFASPMVGLTDEESTRLIQGSMNWAYNPSVWAEAPRDGQAAVDRASAFRMGAQFRRRFPDLLLQLTFVTALVTDLRVRGLVRGEWPSEQNYELPVFATDLGRQFLRFIKSPFEVATPVEVEVE